MDVELARSPQDAEAAEAVRTHHAHLAGRLQTLTEAVVRAATRADRAGVQDARTTLVTWAEDELVPHAMAEEAAMYPAAHAQPEGRLLVDGMLAEHGVITGLVRQVAEAADPVRTAAAAAALRIMFDAHLAKENDLVLPLLLATPGVSVAGLLGGMHELLGEEEHGRGKGTHAHDVARSHGLHGHRESEVGGQGCTCGEKDPAGHPELDARSIPHAIRHASIFGALDGVAAGGGLVLVAPHDPLPLLDQVQHRYAGAFAVSYLERGPEAWRLLFHRAATA